MKRLHSTYKRSAAALLLALWAMFVLSAAVLVWAAFIQQTISVAGETQNDTEARAMAHSGIAIGMHPLVKKETPALQLKAGADPGFEVQLISEGGKLNINTLLANEDPKKLIVLKRWLENRGIDFNERERIVDCMLDWIDGDNLKRTNGEEDLEGYHPPNRNAFLSVDEVAQVAGTENLVKQPGWKDDLTTYSSGTIDLTSADAHILRLLPGVGDVGIERFLQWRRGADQVDGTIDDPPLEKLDQAQAFLGLDKNSWNALGGLIGLRDAVWRIKSTGHSGKVVRHVEVVVRKGGQSPQIIEWKE